MAELLRMVDVWSGYGQAIVLEGILLGRNGMGKTTLISTLMGAARLSRGTIHFAGQDIAHVAGHRRARAGLGWVPQERDIFASLTVEENLSVVARPGAWNLERVYATFPRLRQRCANMGDQLSGGEQQMLAMGRALMLNPRLLLLDEPLEGLAPLIAQELLRVVGAMIAQGDTAVILVEQHAHQILPLTRQAIVLERGKVAWRGASAALAAETGLLERLIGVTAG
jgi:branched-chain amino acid transport system ATP-binding protein